MANFFLCFSPDGDTVNRQVLLKFSSAPKALSLWETQTRTSIPLISAVIYCPDSLPYIIFKTTHSFSQLAGIHIYTVPHKNKPLERKIKYFLILPETQAKEGEN